jgi:SAM-dependent methyltransferase
VGNFDSVAARYEEIHNRNMRLVGESSDTFVRHKVDVLARFWEERGLPRDGRLLDLGCGIGRSYPVVKAAMPGVRYLGIDPSEESIRVAQSQGDTQAFRCYDGASIPSDDASIDVVFAACVLHHVPPAARDALYAEVRRVLRPGGYFFVFEHNPNNPATQYLVRTCEFDDDAVLLRSGELRRALRRGGLRADDRQFVLFLPRALRERLPGFERALAWCPLGAQYWVAAQRPR